MRLSGTSRNDTDDFFTPFLIESMHDQENRTGPYGSNCYPSLLIVRSEVALRKSVGIIENEHGRFKANIVLAKVCAVFLFIPFKSHKLVANQDRICHSVADVNTFVRISPGNTNRANHHRERHD